MKKDEKAVKGKQKQENRVKFYWEIDQDILLANSPMDPQTSCIRIRRPSPKSSND